MLSFNSYGEWTKTSEDIDGASFHIDFQTVKKLDNGNVVFWTLIDNIEEVDGFMSSKIYWQGDCNLSGFKVLSLLQYEEPMGGGEIVSLDGLIGLEGADAWQYLPPDSIGYMNLEEVCLLADQSSMNNYQSKVLELIAEFESYEWEGDEREQYEQLLEQEVQAEEDLIENQKAKLQSAWIRNIAAEVKSVWNFPGAEDGWFVKVLITQNREGKVLNVKFGENNVGNSSEAKAFIDSVERAIYKSSPLPIAPDASVWDSNIRFTFYP